MSTIAYRDGWLASDSGAWAGDSFFGDTQKIFLVPFGDEVALMGLVGDLYACIKFRLWFMNEYLPEGECIGEGDLKPEDPVEAIVIYPDGAVELWDSNLVPYYMKMDFYALGNGRDFAIGAMEAGATAEQAIEAACKYDAHTQGPVTKINIWEVNNE